MRPLGRSRRRFAARSLVAVCPVIFSVPTVWTIDATATAAPLFERDVLPILARHCHECHGEDVQEGQLDLRTLSEILRGGESGPAIVSGKPAESLLVDLVASGQMPPDADDRPTAAEVEVLRRWVETGASASEQPIALPQRSQLTAADRDFWAFRPPRKAAEPAVAAGERVRTPIDAFLLARLEAEGLTFSPDADRLTLLRRASLDLTGLPPDPARVQAFCADGRPDAYERLVDDLLASPHYGERWGRHWLDAAGYVDTRQMDNDLAVVTPNEGIWRYRDYVIRAFNADKPFDRFLTEQLAGDELVEWRSAAGFSPETVELLTATGFLRNVIDDTGEPQYGIEKRYEVLNHVVDMVGTAVMGLTMDCCRCHNHKYDPLAQRDYYRLMACFETGYNVNAWKRPQERFLADVALPERRVVDEHNAVIDRLIAEEQKKIDEARTPAVKRLVADRLMAVPEAVRQELAAALPLRNGQRTREQKELVRMYAGPLRLVDPPHHNLPVADIDAATNDAEKDRIAAAKSIQEQLTAGKRSYGIIQALWDEGDPPASRVHRRGNSRSPGVMVQPGFPEVLRPVVADGAGLAAASTARPDDSAGGRRLALATWLTSPNHPLTARVNVNRVWHHHFGRGIVESLGNFGRSGSGPTHPELLDWLAVDFVEHGWSTKRLHRQIMLSTAYRQASRPPGEADAGGPLAAGRAVDPGNRLLWRMNMRRLDAESIRDSILAASGALDRGAGGPPVPITAPADGDSTPKSEPTPTSQFRRSVYLFARRTYPLKFLEVFDAPIMPVNCTQRMTSATPLQSLAALNSEFMCDQAERMAARVAAAGSADATSRVTLAYTLAYGRPPRPHEAEHATAFLADLAGRLDAGDKPPADAALVQLCHMLLASNEFLYVD